MRFDIRGFRALCAFHPRLRKVAPLSGVVSAVAFHGLRTLRVLAHGYEKSRPTGGYMTNPIDYFVFSAARVDNPICLP